MKIKFFSVFLSLLLIFNIGFTQPVSKKFAEKVAINHFYKAINSIDYAKNISNQINLTCINTPNKESYNFYVFNVNNDKGFVIVSSDYRVKPILAYSTERNFNIDNIAPSQQLFLDYYSNSISYAEKNLKASKEVLEKWEVLLSYNFGDSFKSKTTVEPLLGDINWNQTWPYNAHSPEDPDGFAGRVPVGCVATAMLQIMKFYNWPPTGTGSVYHSTFNNGGYGNYHINFEEHTYSWHEVPNTASSNYNPELAKLNLHAAVSVRMRWGPNGSASDTERIVDALKDYFYYSNALSFERKDFYSENNWKALLREQIDNNLPMVYRGMSTDGGHAWNCDGYQGDDHFHMNWGWGGSGNGYYTLNDLTSTATAGGDENNFVNGQRAIINIYPVDNYPTYCQSVFKIEGIEGSFDDGSGFANNYREHSNCYFLIEPKCGAIISLDFEYFDLADGDEVLIYNGDINPNNLLSSLSSNNIPEGTYRVNTGSMTLHFKSNNSDVANGWKASYSVRNCLSGIELNSREGEFSDGSGICNYENSTVCSWIIEPEDANSINMIFDEFELGSPAHFVRIYENSISSANLIYDFSSLTPPTEELQINSGRAVVQFFSGTGDTGKGWRARYKADGSFESNILDNTNQVSDLIKISPNPGNSNSIIFFNSKESKNLDIAIYSIEGKLINKKYISISKGDNKISLSQLMSRNIDNGTYYIIIESDQEIKSKKFIYLEN